MIELIISIIAFIVALTSMLIARHYYYKTKAIHDNLRNRSEVPRYGRPD